MGREGKKRKQQAYRNVAQCVIRHEYTVNVDLELRQNDIGTRKEAEGQTYDLIGWASSFYFHRHLLRLQAHLDLPAPYLRARWDAIFFFSFA